MRLAIAVTCVVLLMAALRAAEAESDAELLKRLDMGIATTVKALAGKQGTDGGWHGETYGVMKPGVALTAHVLEALARLPEAERKPHAEALGKALKFLREATDKDGAVGLKGEWPEYPTYSTALAIMACARLKSDGWEKDAETWAKWLTSAQHTDATDCEREDTAFGGWDPQGRWRKGTKRHADLSATRYAFQALDALLRTELRELVCLPRHLVKSYVLKCRIAGPGAAEAEAGGFFFTTTSVELNKAGAQEQNGGITGRAYGSATADALICLTGSDDKAAREAAITWLWKHAKLDRVHGIPADDPQRKGWDRAMLFYYRAAVAEALVPYLAKNERPWIRSLAEVTLAAQREDGLFANEISLMKEDEPLIATPNALRTLLICREALAK